MQLSGNKILITGGASGIGYGLAERFIMEKNTVIVCGRRDDVLKTAQSKLPGLITFTCDLAQASERVRLFEWIKKEHNDLSVLVNNAGIQQWTHVEAPDFYERSEAEIEINIKAPVHLSSLFIQLSSLRAIVNVTSGLSFVPLVKVAVYSATKAFFHSFTLSLREQLRAKNIEVIEIIPPAMNTDLGGKGLHDHAPPVGELINATFVQLAEGKHTITYGMSEGMSQAGPADVQQIFARMNQLQS